MSHYDFLLTFYSKCIHICCIVSIRQRETISLIANFSYHACIRPLLGRSKLFISSLMPANHIRPRCLRFLITARSKLREVLFLALFVTFCLCFVWVSNISGMAERICAKFTGKTCLVPRSESLNVKVKGQRSRSPGTKMRCVLPSPPVATEWYVLLHDAT